MNWFTRLFKPRTPPTSPESGVYDLGDDPLDPHGDGTIRPGDALFDMMTQGRPMISNRRPDGQWDVRILDDEES